MKRLLPLTFTASVVLAGGLAAGSVSATSADDQAAADAAVTAFNERMNELGGISHGVPESETIGSEPAVVSMDPSEYGTVPVDPGLAGEPPGAGSSEPPGAAPATPEFDCFEGFVSALDPDGSLEGETARAFAEDFTFESTEEPESTDPVAIAMANDDEITAAVVTVDAEHQGVIDEFIAVVGSEDVATCLEETIENSGVLPGIETEAEVIAETDIGVGDASAHFGMNITTTVNDGDPSEFHIDFLVARTERSLAFVRFTYDVPQTSELDPQEELTTLLESL